MRNTVINVEKRFHLNSNILPSDRADPLKISLFGNLKVFKTINEAQFLVMRYCVNFPFEWAVSREMSEF